MATPESINLWFKDARSDKVYNVELTQCETGWTVIGYNGKRGSTLTPQLKIERAPYEEAKAEYDRLVNSRLAKGYQRVEDAAAKHATRFDAPAPVLVGPALTRSRAPISKEVKFAPELLTRIEVSEAKAYAQNPRYGFQQKRDGIRLTVCVENGNAFGYNKLGQVVALDPQLYKLVLAFCDANNIKDLLLDGEWEATGFWAWDMLQFGPIDARQSSYRDRYRSLDQAFGGADTSLIHVVPIAWTTDEKLALWNKLQEDRAEGFAVKDGNAVYRGGRNGQHFKFKFEVTHSFIVGQKPKVDDHRSVAVYVFDSGRKRLMGSVKVAGCYDVPADGAVIDVRYLYCFQGREGRIYQPSFFGVVRADVRPEDCVVQQLKMKQDEEAA
jgi:bifunctional non-homologous end joining protein LigD